MSDVNERVREPKALDDTGEFAALSELAEPTDVTLEEVERGGDSAADRPSTLDEADEADEPTRPTSRRRHCRRRRCRRCSTRATR